MFKKRNDFKQEIFDKVYKHILQQNERAMDITNRCMYQTSNGLKYAVGCLIPDSDYSPMMEKKSVRRIDYFHNAGYSSEEIELLYELQVIHDVYEVHEWKSKLKNCAEKHGLTLKEV